MNIQLLVVVLVFIVIDIVVGLIKALKNGSYRSIKMREGLFHKIGEMIAVAFGYLCEQAFPIIGITITIPIVSTICIYIVLMETGSIIENLTEISPNIKNMLKKIFSDYEPESGD